MLARSDDTASQPADAPAQPDATFLADKIERWATSRLRPDLRNARKHAAEQIEDLRGIIRRLGFVRPIMAREDGMIIAGEGRWTAAVLEGLTEVPVIPKPPHWSEQDCQEYALADNALGLRSTWDNSFARRRARRPQETRPPGRRARLHARRSQAAGAESVGASGEGADARTAL